jgi:hypothetical protein
MNSEIKELKKQNSELEEASKEKDPSYYDFFFFFFSPRKSSKAPSATASQSSGTEERSLDGTEESVSSNSSKSALYQLPKEYRKDIEVSLKVPRTSLVNFYKDSVGKPQKFTYSITKVLISAEDSNYDSSVHECNQETSVLKSIVTPVNSLETKNIILKSSDQKAHGDYTVNCSTIGMIDTITSSEKKYTAYEGENVGCGSQSKSKTTIKTAITDPDDKK